MSQDLFKKMQKDLAAGQKARDFLLVSCLRLALAQALNREKEKRAKIAHSFPELEAKELEKRSRLCDEELIEVLSFEIKKRKESIFAFEQGKRQDLAEKEKKEMDILMRYMPSQLSEKELKIMVEEAIKNQSAKSLQDMGKVMAELMPKIKGRADGSLTSKMVKEALNVS